MTTQSNRSNRQISNEGRQEVTSSDHDDNVYPSHYLTWYTGTEEETEPGAVSQLRSTDKITAAEDGHTPLDLPSVPPPSYNDVCIHCQVRLNPIHTVIIYNSVQYIIYGSV